MSVVGKIGIRIDGPELKCGVFDLNKAFSSVVFDKAPYAWRKI